MFTIYFDILHLIRRTHNATGVAKIKSGHTPVHELLSCFRSDTNSHPTMALKTIQFD